MTILTPPPAFMLPSRFTIAPVANTQSGGRSPFNGSEQFLRQPGERWTASLGWQGMRADEWRPLFAFLTSLGGRAGRFTWSPATLMPRRAAGIAGRTNLVPNGQFAGAGPGEPGIGWALTAPNGGAAAVTATGIEDGVAYLELSISGNRPAIDACSLEMTVSVPHAPGRVLTGAATLQVIGTPSNVTQIRVGLVERDGSDTLLLVHTAEDVGVEPLIDTSVRRSVTTVGVAGAAGARLRVDVRVIADADYDLTLRIAQPQLERGSPASAYIPTSGGPATVFDGPNVEGANQLGASLVLRGFAAGAQAFLAGDFLGFTDPTGRPRLHVATADVSAAESGRCSVPIAPPLRNAPTDGALVLIDQPPALWRLTTDSTPMDVLTGLQTGGADLNIEEPIL